MFSTVKARKILTGAVLGYLGAVLAFWLSLALIGERNWLINLLLFFPLLPLAVPALILFPPCFKDARRLCWILIGAGFFVLFCQMRFHWSFWQSGDKNALSIVTNNIGERRLQTLVPFLEEEQPDMIVLQDASHRARALSLQYPG